MKLDVITLDGADAGSIDLSDAVFGIDEICILRVLVDEFTDGRAEDRDLQTLRTNVIEYSRDEL